MNWNKKKISLEGKDKIEIAKDLKQKAVRYLSLKPRLRAELETHLGNSFDSDNPKLLLQLIEEVCEEFEKRKFLNDKELIEHFTSHQLTVKLKGPLWIQMKLAKRGAPRNLINEALSNITQAMELDVVKQLARKRLKDTSEKSKAKFVRFLASRGFSGRTIRAIFDYSLSN